MKKYFAVIGLGRFGLGIVEELSNFGVEVIAIDINPEAVSEAGEFVTQAIVCDSTSEKALREAGIQNVDHAVVAIGNNISHTILTTINLSQLGIKKITVRVDNDYYNSVITKLGATDIILPEKSAGMRVANKIVSDSFLDYYNVGEYSVVSVLVCDDFESITLQELDPRNRFDINVALIERDDKFFLPRGTDFILPKDEVLIIGKKKNVNKFEQYVNSGSKESV